VTVQDWLRLGLITMVIILNWKSGMDGDLRFSMAQQDVLEHRERLVFLCLILAQGAHSIEEYVTRLYVVFPPARFVSSLVSQMTLPQTASRLVRQELKQERKRLSPKKLPAQSVKPSATRASQRKKNAS